MLGRLADEEGLTPNCAGSDTYAIDGHTTGTHGTCPDCGQSMRLNDVGLIPPHTF